MKALKTIRLFIGHALTVYLHQVAVYNGPEARIGRSGILHLAGQPFPAV